MSVRVETSGLWHEPGAVSRGVMWPVVVAIVVLNLLDAIATMIWVELGIAEEANALLDHLLHRDAVLFMAVKLALVSLGVTLLWRYRRRPLAVAGLVLALATYGSLAVYHVHIAGVAWAAH